MAKTSAPFAPPQTRPFDEMDPRVKSVVFDLDGTLIDSAPDIHAAINQMLHDVGLAPLDLATVTSFIGNGLPTLVERTMKHVGLPMEQHADLTRKTLDFYNAAPTNLTVFYDGVLDLLSQLRAAGIKIGLCTNKPYAPAMAILRDFDILDYFDVVIGGDSLPQRKPDPAPLYAAIQALGSTEILYVGDSEIDYATAQNANVPFAFFTGGYRTHSTDYFENCWHFNHFADLSRHLNLETQ